MFQEHRSLQQKDFYTQSKGGGEAGVGVGVLEMILQ